MYGRLNQALYEIEIPSQWNGEVVMYAHGFVGSEPFLHRWAPLHCGSISSTREGFAVGRVQFQRQRLRSAGRCRTILLALLDFFKQHVGVPRRAYIYGSSMGGHVLVSSLEEHPDVYAGALSECGVVAGVEEMDFLLGYEALGHSTLPGLNLLPVRDIDSVRGLGEECADPGAREHGVQDG